MASIAVALFIFLSGFGNETRSDLDCLSLALEAVAIEQAQDVDLVYFEDCTVGMDDES